MAKIIKLTPEVNKPLNTFKWSLIIILFCVALTLNYTYPQLAPSLRLLSWLLLGLTLGGIFLSTHQGHRFYSFAKAAKNELRKVVWPSRQETIQSTLAVLILVSILSIILWMMDSVWLWLITLITG